MYLLSKKLFMKTKFIIALIIITNLGFSSVYPQINNGIVTYTSTSKLLAIVKENVKNNNVKPFVIKMGKRIDKSLEDIEFKLLFSKDESLFQVKEKLNKDEIIIGLAIITVGGDGLFYINIDSKEKLHQKEAFGGRFLIKDYLKNINWKLLKETKKIGKYNCNKATTIKLVVNDKGTFRKKVIAWYAPEIPVSFGPIGYGGLPGLILELDIENESNFLAKKIELNFKKEIIIKKPTKGKLVSQKEFEDIEKKSDPWSRK